MTEAEFQQQVLDLAKLYGWRTYHTYDSRRSAAGFPDLVLVKDKGLIITELKTDAGRVTSDQRKWMDALLQVDSPPLVEVWRPRDLGYIAKKLGPAGWAA